MSVMRGSIHPLRAACRITLPCLTGGLMKLPLWVVDAFCTSTPFSGNPAAVCPLAEWQPDATLQGIAAQNNLSETAFLLSEPGGYRIRWFTPTIEVPLC